MHNAQLTTHRLSGTERYYTDLLRQTLLKKGVFLTAVRLSKPSVHFFFVERKSGKKKPLGGEPPSRIPPLSSRNYSANRVIAHDGNPATPRFVHKSGRAQCSPDGGRGCSRIVIIRLCKGMGIRRVWGCGCVVRLGCLPSVGIHPPK